jgi:hypothetical protein
MKSPQVDECRKVSHRSIHKREAVSDLDWARGQGGWCRKGREGREGWEAGRRKQVMMGEGGPWGFEFCFLFGFIFERSLANLPAEEELAERG